MVYSNERKVMNGAVSCVGMTSIEDDDDVVIQVNVVIYVKTDSPDTYRNGEWVQGFRKVYTAVAGTSADDFVKPLWTAPYYLHEESLEDVMTGWSMIMMQRKESVQ